MSNISQETINKIIELYKSGKTTYETADIVKHSQSFIITTLKNNNIERRTPHSYTRKYNINEKFFDIINTEEKAYFLGLMFADGNNYRSEKNNKGKDYQISIKLQAEDKEILEIFRDKIDKNLSLTFNKSKNIKYKDTYKFNFDSKIISDQLVKLGCIPNKSLILKYPNISENLQNHFLRGYFDGDGSISYWIKKGKTNKNYVCSITSTSYFCDSARQIIKKLTDLELYLRLTHPKLNNITTTISIGGNNQVYKLMCWLYKDATVFLKRKHNKFLELEKLIK